MILVTHEEFMALEGPVLYTEHFIIPNSCGSSYSNYSPLMMRVGVIDTTHFESILIDSSVQELHVGFDIPLEPYTIKGYGSPDKVYRVFSKDDIKTLMGNLQNILEGKIEC